MRVVRASCLMLGFMSVGFGSQVDGAIGRSANPQQADAPPQTSEVPRNTTNFRVSWPDFPTSFSLNTSIDIHYTLEIITQNTQIALQLMQSGSDGRSGQPVNSDNTWAVVNLQNELCKGGLFRQGEPCEIDMGLDPSFNINLQRVPEHLEDNLQNFFFCFGLPSPSTCEAPSPMFWIKSGPFESVPVPFQNPLSSSPSALTIAATSPILGTATPTAALKGTAASSQATGLSESQPTPFASLATSVLTVSIPPTGTTTIMQTPTDVSASFVEPSSNNKLSTGAIAGIAVGAVIFLAILASIFIFCCCRRRRKSRNHPGSAPEQVMLTHSMLGEFPSRDQLAEKDLPRTLIHPNSNDSTQFNAPYVGGAAFVGQHEDNTPYVDEDGSRDLDNSPSAPNAIPLQRHSALSPYDSIPSAPYSGAAASPPRRNPTSATQTTTVSRLSSSHSQSHSPTQATRHALSRNLSSSTTASTQNPISPHSATSEYPSYRDEHSEPRYGDTRHSPQVFQGGTLQSAPFLSEPGMSAEEVARLEEEERRIDAAIAAAEAREGGGR